jgi:hypothetical protein
MGDADMLEHADRDDAVEGLGNVAVVLQPKLDPIGKPGLPRASRGDGELFLGERDPRDASAANACEIEPKTPEPAADIERGCVVLRQELGGDMTLLCGLGLLQRLAGIFEIGAGILAVGIEEKIVEPLIEVVVARDIAPGAQPVVALVEATKRQAKVSATPSALITSRRPLRTSLRKKARNAALIPRVPNRYGAVA